MGVSLLKSKSTIPMAEMWDGQLGEIVDSIPYQGRIVQMLRGRGDTAVVKDTVISIGMANGNTWSPPAKGLKVRPLQPGETIHVDGNGGIETAQR